MTTSELYAVYCQAYGDYDQSLGSTTPVIVARTAIERAVVEFAVEDAANGTPLRTQAQFAKAVSVGVDALAPLGLQAA